MFKAGQREKTRNFQQRLDQIQDSLSREKEDPKERKTQISLWLKQLFSI
jgi:thymidylate synthase